MKRPVLVPSAIMLSSWPLGMVSTGLTPCESTLLKAGICMKSSMWLRLTVTGSLLSWVVGALAVSTESAGFISGQGV